MFMISSHHSNEVQKTSHHRTAAHGEGDTSKYGTCWRCRWGQPQRRRPPCPITVMEWLQGLGCTLQTNIMWTIVVQI